jgi:hypothetical protein
LKDGGKEGWREKKGTTIRVRGGDEDEGMMARREVYLRSKFIEHQE